MNILTLLGSPRKKGNTARVLSMFEEKVAGDHEVERVIITKHEVKGCIGCYKCQEVKGEPGCVQKDDAEALFEKMMQADAIVYASPLYCWSFTAQLKPLIDRHFCLVTGYGTSDFESLLQNKKAALLVTCAGPVEDNCEAIQHIFQGLSQFIAMDGKGTFILPHCTTPDAIGADGEEVAGKLAAAIVE